MPLGSVKLAQNQLGTIRLAVVVSKKVAKSAPKRNRIRRRIYEIVRRDLPSLKPGYDIMVSVFDENVFTMPAPELERQFADLWQKTSLRQ
jgi:ribonuclease P protein component